MPTSFSQLQHLAAALAGRDDKVRFKLLQVEARGQELDQWCWAACTEMFVDYLRREFGGELPPEVREQESAKASIRQGEQVNLRLPAEKRVFDCTRVETAEEYEVCNFGGWPYFYEFDEAAQSTEWSSLRFVLEELGMPLREDGWPRRVESRLSSGQLRDLVRGFSTTPKLLRRLYDAEDCALSWEMLTGILDEGSPVFFSWRWSRGGHLMIAAGYATTPPDGRWVLVLNPLPPRSGDIHLMPYEHWVAGPYGRHWRDYWVPRPRAGQPLPPRHAIDDLRVGRELVRSWVPVVERRPDREEGLGKHELSPADRRQVRELAEEGLEAVRAIAAEAPELAALISIGGGTLRGLLETALTAAADRKRPEIDWERKMQVEPESLRLAKSYLPIYDVTRKDLLLWDGTDPEELLTAPREVIWEVVRGDYEIYDHFTALRIRRYDDRWRLVAIATAFTSINLAVQQLVDGLLAAFAAQEARGALSAQGLVEHLSELGLLRVAFELAREGLAKQMASAESLRDLVGDPKKSGTTKGKDKEAKEIVGELQRIFGAETLDGKALHDVARRIDKALGVEYSKPDVPQPEYIVDVLQLYQQFIAYSDDDLVPVYDAAFYPPGSRIEPGDAANVLRQLKLLAGQV